ncbi:MAG: hypothetical protein P0116_12290 [Candidatus Nitrosocosmicus sp.]|nr:hypothetical protein [Candidatus Nitrosocosmicus sp.]
MCNGNSTFPIFNSEIMVYEYYSSLNDIQYTSVISNTDDFESMLRLVNEVDA